MLIGKFFQEVLWNKIRLWSNNINQNMIILWIIIFTQSTDSYLENIYNKIYIVINNVKYILLLTIFVTMHPECTSPSRVFDLYTCAEYRAAVNGQVRFGLKCRRPEARRSRVTTPPSPLPSNIRVSLAIWSTDVGRWFAAVGESDRHKSELWCDFEPGHSDFSPPLRTQSRARLFVW